MKKSLIALAVMAASGASFAQSNATIYGIVDIWLGTVNSVSHAGNDGVTQTKIDAGGVSHNRLGFKGSEDLGGGLKANFQLEQGFSMDSGAADSTTQAFSRYANVGFSGGFGEVKLGKTGTAYDDMQGATDAVFDSALSPVNWVFTSVNYNWTPSNTIYYLSPEMSGFSAGLSYSLGENKTATVDAGSTVAINVQYNGGPLYVGLGHQTEKTNGSSASIDFTRINASYDLGVAKVLGSYGRTELSGSSSTEWQLGVDVPVSAALTVSGSYASSTGGVYNMAGGSGVTASAGTVTTAGQSDVKRSGFGIAGNYAFSKRTSIYGGYMAMKEDANASVGFAADSEVKILALGIRHAF